MVKQYSFLLAAISIIAGFSLYLTKVPRVEAARAHSTNRDVGNDISWPQCGKTLPTKHAFGIVGVNGGLATTTNPCLSEQLVWALQASGTTSQAKIQLYVNTANPGGLGTASWPSSNYDSRGNLAPNPHGTCSGTDSLACAWQYGWNRAVQDVHDRLKPAAISAGMNPDPAVYRWWLDVETENTWKSGSSFAFQSNRTVLEAMTAYFQSLGASVGIYSTTYQWGQIAGSVDASSNLYTLPSWLAGARSLNGAITNCSNKPLNGGSKVVLTQYVSGSFDYNYACR